MTGGGEAFDLTGVLPHGLTVLEASAGTGKTWSIAALVARYVAEGVPVDQLLVVTFTRAATGELRDRVRERLRTTEAALGAVAEGRVPPEGTGDPVVGLLAAAGPERAALARARLAAAAADFDAATVTTTHGFCDLVLAGLGTAGDIDRDVRFEADTSELAEEVVDDLFVAASLDGGVPLDATEARQVGRAVMGHPGAAICPDPSEDSPGAARARFAAAVRAEVDRRKLRASTIDYDDLLVRLVRSLQADRAGEACRRFRDRYRVALVDEFQDTDPLQWQILRQLFADAGSTLVLIGDPKQAIYNFRGADVRAYLAAAGRAERSATLGDDSIAYRRVRPAPDADRVRLDAPRPEALRVRVAFAGDIRTTAPGKRPLKGPARQAVAADLAAEVLDLVDGHAALTSTGGPSGPDREPLHPGHVAVLVSTNREADLVHRELTRVGVPAVISGAGSVFASPAALEWRLLLEALERPSSELRGRAVVRTAFFGWSDERVAAATEADLAGLASTLRHWASVLEGSGVAALAETVSVATGLPARVLARPGGERAMTDLDHVAQLLHAESSAGRLGVNALTAWLRTRIRRAGSEGSDAAEERTRRLETDADAVQVITVHRSKGLEFPVVCLPFLWATGYRRLDPLPVCQDPHDPLGRIVDVGGSGPALRAHQLAADREDRDEELRRAYVALTRARHQVLLWWVGPSDSGRTALARLLCRDRAGRVGPTDMRAPTDEDVWARFERLAAAAPGAISVERLAGRPRRAWRSAPPSRPALDVATFDRSLDTRWRRLSYTAITAGSHPPPGSRVASEPDGGDDDDERLPDLPAPDPAGTGTGPGGAAARSPMADVVGGTAVGTLVHAALEGLAFDAPDLPGAVAAAVAAARARHAPVPGLDPAALGAALTSVVDSPLGPDIGVGRLRDVGAGDRLDELDFEFPLAGGDHPAGTVRVADVAALLAGALPPGDALAAYPGRLAAPDVNLDLRGYLTGSIDLVVRAPAPDGTPRFHVVDYKTNRLAGPGAELTLDRYRPSVLAEAMMAGHYPLQALLYTVALHRYLRWRLPAYDPDRHLGACHYLFVRGMAGAATPLEAGRPCGVFAWRPPAGLVAALSDLLDAAPGAAGAPA